MKANNNGAFGGINYIKAKIKGFLVTTNAESLAIIGGDEGNRTPDLYVANVPLSQLSYIPTVMLICHFFHFYSS